MTAMSMSEPATSVTDLRLCPQALAQLRSFDPKGGSGVVVRILTVFISSALRQREQIVQALASDDAPALGRVAHTLRPSAQSIGALALGQMADQIERAVRAGALQTQLPPTTDFVAALDAAVAAAQREIEACG